ncbi:hypothetical protein KC328_g103 [Hortaea werneckii]|nr:hypothetical protein KC328_g103 [Hortaea werneckii]
MSLDGAEVRSGDLASWVAIGEFYGPGTCAASNVQTRVDVFWDGCQVGRIFLPGMRDTGGRAHTCSRYRCPHKLRLRQFSGLFVRSSSAMLSLSTSSNRISMPRFARVLWCRGTVGTWRALIAERGPTTADQPPLSLIEPGHFDTTWTFTSSVARLSHVYRCLDKLLRLQLDQVRLIRYPGCSNQTPRLTNAREAIWTRMFLPVWESQVYFIWLNHLSSILCCFVASPGYRSAKREMSVDEIHSDYIMMLEKSNQPTSSEETSEAVACDSVNG